MRKITAKTIAKAYIFMIIPNAIRPAYTTKEAMIDVYTTHFGNLLQRTTKMIDSAIERNIIPTVWRATFAKIEPKFVLFDCTVKLFARSLSSFPPAERKYIPNTTKIIINAKKIRTQIISLHDLFWVGPLLYDDNWLSNLWLY